MTQEECPFRSSRVLHDDKGEFHLCNREGGDCECIPSGCPYLIAKNSKLNLPDLPGYVQIDDEQGVCIDSLQVQETCKENQDSFTSLEEAAKEYATTHLRNNEFPTADSAFIEGAKWHEQQMIKEAVDGYVTFNYDAQKEGLPCVTVIADEKSMEFYESRGFKLGDKVKVIIVKK